LSIRLGRRVDACTASNVFEQMLSSETMTAREWCAMMPLSTVSEVED
jgi:hypothetical protein